MSTENEMRRQLDRLLKTLQAGPRTVVPGAVGDRVVLEVSDGPAVSARIAILRQAIAAGLVRMEGTSASLTGQAVGMLRREAAGEGGYAAQHQERIQLEVGDAQGSSRVTVNLAESPLAQIARRKDREGRPFLDAAEVAAGERLRSDFTRARIAPRLGINWDAPTGGGKRSGPGSGMGDMTDAALDARRRVDGAVAAVGPELAGVLLDICCFLKGLEEVERERCWPVRSAKLMLKTALAALARHYEPPRPRRRGIVHWGAENYRPTQV
jgi:hypothetical protein